EILTKLQPVEIFGMAEDADWEARGIAAGFGGHLAELVDRFDALGLEPVVSRNPPVAVTKSALGGGLQPAADDDRWMGLLEGLGPHLHLVELHELAVMLGLLIGPDRLHRLDALARQLVAALERRAMVLDLVLVPAIANAEQEAALAQLVDGRDLLGSDDGVTL